MERRVAPPNCLWQMPVALQSEAAPRFGQWVQTRPTLKWWCRWVAQWEPSFRSVMLLVWNLALNFVTVNILLARPVSPLNWPPWPGDLPSAVTDQESATSSLHLPQFKSPAIVQAWSATTKQCEFVDFGDGHKARLLLRRRTIGSQSVAKTMDLLVGNLTACSCYTWQSPTNCNSTFAH